MKKEVRFDDLEGGAIANTRLFESSRPVAYPTHTAEDYTTVMRNADFYKFDGSTTQFYNNALNMIPRNIYPLFMYDQASRGSNPALVKNALLQGVSGFGAHKDSPHIQKAVVHSLKPYPELLRMYLNSKNLILAV